jgi:murein DD-endopeptidase
VKAVPHLARPSMTLLALLALAMLTACASGPRRTPGLPDAATLGERIAATALAQLGKPYRYGGNGPAAFDCSGLVRFAHAAHGIAVPRTTGDQFGAATPVPEQQLAAGDLLFFRFEAGPKVTHVAIYMGEGRFVHAPQGGRNVERGRLADPWFRQRLAGTGRLH